MSKQKTVFVCQQCGHRSLRWQGRCEDCGEWNSLVEEQVLEVESTRPGLSDGVGPQLLQHIVEDEAQRLTTGIGELDRLLGGGAVVGSVVLVGGDPGIGKSTLLLQACAGACQRGCRALYVTGEESVAQTRLRARRLGIETEELYVVAETCLEQVLEHIRRVKPHVVVVDSIQMMYRPALGSAPGSVSQVRECALALVAEAKSSQRTIFLIGHVTKEGTLAGPRVLEHMVDTVLYFEGDRYHSFRVLRAVKNRFGATNEIGVFEMKSGGLAEVENPSALFLSEDRAQAPGCAVVATIEGTRPLLVEVQALVSPANFGTPERKVSGVDYNRLCMLLAVLERRGGMRLAGQDVFVNVVGGVQIDEPASDLAVAASIASSIHDRAILPGTVLLGEIGLAGEVRAVNHCDERVAESTKLGFQRVILPRENLRSAGRPPGLKLRGVRRLIEALECALED